MEKNRGRVVGLDVHPDSFAGAVVEGTDPADARVLSSSTQVELERLEQWALRHTRVEDTLVLEASGNAFSVAMRLRAIGRKAEILNSHRAGKVGKVYCANDRVDAVKIARIYLSALSPIVWQPDEEDLGAARDLQRLSGGSKGIDPGQATAALDVERTLRASGEGFSTLSPQRHQALAYTPRVDAGAQDVTAIVARHFGGSANTSHAAAPIHGSGNRGRGSAAALDTTVRH
jgi:hypothetical protein